MSFDKVVALMAVKYLHLHMREQDQLARGRILVAVASNLPSTYAPPTKKAAEPTSAP